MSTPKMSPRNPVEVLAASGNINHIAGYIKHYETEIGRRGEASKSLAEAPNYYAWLSTASEFVYYHIREVLYWDEVEIEVKKSHEDAFEVPYSDVLTTLFKDPRVDQAMHDGILLFARIRHLIVHKGFPNVHESTIKAKRNLAQGEPFNETEVEFVRDRLRSPAAYPELLDIYTRTMKSIGALRKTKEFSF